MRHKFQFCIGVIKIQHAGGKTISVSLLIYKGKHSVKMFCIWSSRPGGKKYLSNFMRLSRADYLDYNTLTIQTRSQNMIR